MALSDEVKAARKAARKQETEKARARRAEAASKAEPQTATRKFDGRSTRRSVGESLQDRALTTDEYLAALERGLVGPNPAPEPRSSFDVATTSEWLGAPVSEPDKYEPTPDEVRARADEAERAADWEAWLEYGVTPERDDPSVWDFDAAESVYDDDWVYVAPPPPPDEPFVDDRPEWERSTDDE